MEPAIAPVGSPRSADERVEPSAVGVNPELPPASLRAASRSPPCATVVPCSTAGSRSFVLSERSWARAAVSESLCEALGGVPSGRTIVRRPQLRNARPRAFHVITGCIDPWICLFRHGEVEAEARVDEAPPTLVRSAKGRLLGGSEVGDGRSSISSFEGRGQVRTRGAEGLCV